MIVLGIIDPSDCDERGIPLDWERCRTCGGTGKVPTSEYPGGLGWRCSTCGDYGSLKAAALAHLSPPFHAPSSYRHEPGGPVRCEDCGHPMSEGTWEGEFWPGYSADGHMAYIASLLPKGEPSPGLGPIHYSPCDEGCRHGGPIRVHLHDGSWMAQPHLGPQTYRRSDHDPHDCEASWRPVDVRTLGWPHDLRPERLAVLCLRCWAARSEARP